MNYITEPYFTIYKAPRKLIEKLVSQNSSVISKLDNVLKEQKTIRDRISNFEKTLKDFKKENEQDFLKVRF
jgi:hypothetical protein